MKRIQDWLGVVNSVFGNSVPTPKEAFDAGVKLGKEKG